MHYHRNKSVRRNLVTTLTSTWAALIFRLKSITSHHSELISCDTDKTVVHLWVAKGWMRADVVNLRGIWEGMWNDCRAIFWAMEANMRSQQWALSTWAEWLIEFRWKNGTWQRGREHPFHPQPSTFITTHLWNHQHIITPIVWCRVGGLLRVATIYKNNQRCKSLTIWFMLMWLHFHCCPWVPFFICCAASVAFFVETTFHLQMLKLMNLLCQALSAFSIGKMLKTLYGCHTSCPIRIALPSVSPSRWRYEVLTVLIWVWSPHLPLKLPPLHLICYQNAGAAKQGEKRRRRQGRADREACKRKLQTSVRKQIICNTKLCVLLLEQKDLL